MSLELLLRIGLTSALLVLGAAAAERALREARLPSRGVWLAALAGTVALTLVLVLGGSLPLAAPGAVSQAFTLELVSGAVVDGSAGAAAVAYGRWLWGGISGLLVLLLTAAALRQAGRTRRGRVRELHGARVVLTEDAGPAVAGLLRPAILLPRWVLELPPQQQRFIVRHEREHVTAGDPLVLACALVLVCLVPWNPALWYQLRRLRMAIESDCDQRVLRAGRADQRAYGLLLIEVAGRTERGDPLAITLTHPRSSLERRILMITRNHARPGRAALWALAAAGLLAAACADDADPTQAVGPGVSEATAASTTEKQELIDTELLPLGMDPAVAVHGRLSRIGVEGPGGLVLERTRDGRGEFAVGTEQPSTTNGRSTVARFQVQVGADGRPTAIRFPDESVTESVVSRAREALGTFRFRREADAPADAWVSGFITLE